MGSKSIFDVFLKCRPIRSASEKLNAKIDTKLNQFIQPLNSTVCEARDLQVNAIKLIQDAWNLAIVNHQQVTANQENAFYHSWFTLIHPAFAQTLSKIAGSEFHDIVPYSHLLLMEIARNYLRQGGLWKLEDEIFRFKAPINRCQASPREPEHRPQGRMKILVVSGMFPSIEHGGGLRLFDILSQLAVHHDLDLFSVYTPKIDEYSLQLLQGVFGEVKLVDEATFTPDTLQQWLVDMGCNPGHYDVVQCEYPMSARLIPTAKPYGRKIGFTYMECVTKSLLLKLRNAIADKEFSQMEGLAQSFWEGAVGEFCGARDTDFQIAVTPEDADFVEAVSGIRPEIVPTCLSPSQVLSRVDACKDIVPEPETVIFLGYFDHFPNIDGMKWYLRQVHPEVKRRVPGYRFVVVGAGDTSVLREITKDDDSVIYTGRVDDITPYIMRGKVCVLPLISGAGIRGKLNQYSIAGRPSVTTTIGNLGLNYLDGEAALVADTPAAFADAVVRLLTDNALNSNIASRAQAYARENFTWDRYLDRLVEIYRA